MKKILLAIKNFFSGPETPHAGKYAEIKKELIEKTKVVEEKPVVKKKKKKKKTNESK